jgi:hypothetical protein
VANRFPQLQKVKNAIGGLLKAFILKISLGAEYS